jgi:hypothetical protein
MRSPKSFLDQQGYFTFAQNTESVNYLELAYAQAASIKQTQKINKYAVAVDSETKKLITDKHQKVFDYVVDIVDPVANAMGNEWQAWQLTPFKETIKLESDILFTTNVDHWWTGLRLQEVCFTTKVRDYFGRVSKDRSYRKFFDENNLPDVYTGMYYFRFGQQSLKLFQLAFAIYSNWEYFRDNLKNCREELPSTDVVFAIAARLLGVELCTNPALDYPSFVHMKGSVNHLHSSANWQNILQHELNGTELTINFNRQLWPVHYYQKDFINERHRKELVRSIR